MPLRPDDPKKRKFLPTLDRYEPLVMDHTATKYFMECSRKYFYRIVLGREAKKQNMEKIFAWGTAIHKFAEVLYEKDDYDLALNEAYKLYKLPDPDNRNFAHLTPERFIKTCKALFDFRADEMRLRRTKVLGIEQPFNVDLPNSEQIGGRFDQIVDISGRVWVRDWKTTTKEIRWFSYTLNPNDQATRYAYAASRLRGWTSENPTPNLKADGVMFIVIYNGKTTGPKIEPVPISKSPHQLLQWEREQIHLYKLIDACREADIWPMEPSNCSWCDYASVCRHGSDSSKEYELKNNFDLKPWKHEEVDQVKLSEKENSK